MRYQKYNGEVYAMTVSLHLTIEHYSVRAFNDLCNDQRIDCALKKGTYYRQPTPTGDGYR